VPRRNQLVDTLLERIRPVVERLAHDLALIAAARIERELGRVSEAVEVALSTYASDRPDLITAALGPELAAMLAPPPKPHPTQRCSVHREVFDVGAGCPSCAKETHADPDRRDHDPVPHVQGGAGRGLHGDGTRGLKLGLDARDQEQAAQPADPRREEGERAAGLVEPRSRGEKITCRKCGYLGGNARGCGTSHPTQRPAGEVPKIEMKTDLDGKPWPPPRAKTGPDDQPLTAIEPLRRLKPKPEAVAAAKARIEERRARIRAQAESAQASTRRAAEPEVDDNPTAEERWSSERIEHAKTIAGSLKRDGELPVPRSTFEINQDGAMADVIEVAPGGLAPWGQR
jgi:hypothetical protein